MSDPRTAEHLLDRVHFTGRHDDEGNLSPAICKDWDCVTLRGLIEDLDHLEARLAGMREEGCAAIGMLEAVFTIATSDGAPGTDTKLGRITDLSSQILADASRCEDSAKLARVVEALRDTICQRYGPAEDCHDVLEESDMADWCGRCRFFIELRDQGGGQGGRGE